ncbi:MAG: hypothetical protein ORN98_00280 [Alphaproteobacteria bacterium]|nr:hypothetical protein [Alphaproteobacteria bacterium]
MSKKMLESAQSLSSNVEVGPVTVEESGGLVLDKREKLQFTFEYFGLPFEANFRRDERGGVLMLRAILGNRPFTAENRQVRINLSHVIQSTTNHRDGRLAVDPKEQIVFRAERRIQEILSPGLLVALLIEVLLQNRQLIGLGKILTDSPQAAKQFRKAKLFANPPRAK